MWGRNCPSWATPGSRPLPAGVCWSRGQQEPLELTAAPCCQDLTLWFNRPGGPGQHGQGSGDGGGDGLAAPTTLTGKSQGVGQAFLGHRQQELFPRALLLHGRTGREGASGLQKNILRPAVLTRWGRAGDELQQLRGWRRGRDALRGVRSVSAGGLRQGGPCSLTAFLLHAQGLVLLRHRGPRWEGAKAASPQDGVGSPDLEAGAGRLRPLRAVGLERRACSRERSPRLQQRRPPGQGCPGPHPRNRVSTEGKRRVRAFCLPPEAEPAPPAPPPGRAAGARGSLGSRGRRGTEQHGGAGRGHPRLSRAQGAPWFPVCLILPVPAKTRHASSQRRDAAQPAPLPPREPLPERKGGALSPASSCLGSGAPRQLEETACAGNGSETLLSCRERREQASPREKPRSGAVGVRGSGPAEAPRRGGAGARGAFLAGLPRPALPPLASVLSGSSGCTQKQTFLAAGWRCSLLTAGLGTKP